MGRRKIEIKPIKDDRNRSVTFLKRKAGLFKKAHELAVLCSVDVAVIIFGQNKKLYDYSSCDMPECIHRFQYFNGVREHKGLEDFNKNEDDDDDEDHTPAPEDMQVTQNHPGAPPLLHQQPGFQHINHAPSASPPVPNGLPTRHGTPQSQASRPSSRNHIRRVSSNLGPHQHATPPPPAPPNGFYMPNPSMYNPNVHGAMNQPRPGQYAQFGHPPPGPQGTPPQGIAHPHGLPPQQMPQQHPQQHPQHPQHPQQHQHFQHAHAVASQQMGMPPGSHAPVQQVSQAYMSDQQGRGSMPPSYPENQERGIPENNDNTSGGLKPEHSQSPPQPKSMSKSRSIFTPIDDRGSVLAQHFRGGSMYDQHRMNQNQMSHEESAARMAQMNALNLNRTQSISSAPDIQPLSINSATGPDIQPLQRTNSGQLPSKRPQLKVQIPSESSEVGSVTGDTAEGDSSRDSATKSTPAKGPGSDPPPGNGAGVVLPPPSPSAGAILSAGAQGPPNPFARPPPPQSGYNNSATNGNGTGNGAANTNNNIETPISALPSRFVSDALLPSPSSFFPEWGFGRSGPDSSLLPSPLTFPTPAVGNGPGFGREDEQDKKRDYPDDASPDEETVNKKHKP
ncbi:hypothetical protein N7456_000321 [Penicillium angulare]|uniref:MADS-box domain-containing protein n=1 Tax=Penicillium angulare TaxID=116970 RepID=A0A9W9GDA7_9EURO|nr:hypothetical protein N7456_000321 [Penicillium angulare]